MGEQPTFPRIDVGDRSAPQTVRALLGLRELILRGELAPGERISELAMVDRLGVSRTPLRAALIRLESEGLLEAIPNGGFAVRGFTVSDVFAAMEIRGAIEGLAARFAAERRLTAEALAPASECLGQIDRLIEGGGDAFPAYVALNERFHALLKEFSGSAVIQMQLERANAHPFASPDAFVQVQASLPDASSILVVAQYQHRCVLEAIGAGDGGTAETVMRQHARLAQRNLRTAIENHRSLRLVPGGNLLAIGGD